MLSLIKFLKNILFIFPVTLIISPLNKLMLFLSYYNRLIIWIYKNKKHFEYSDFFSWKRDYNKRYHLYEYIKEKFDFEDAELLYLEFGVANGESFNWWTKNLKNSNTFFVGFDTFEGLPESWGAFYEKGDMRAKVPVSNDSRVLFKKGLFQDTLPKFISEQNIKLSNCRKIIHLDADLYSSTIFVLSQLYPYLKSGDIVMFDEFNVPLHEFKAFSEFSQFSYLTLNPVGAVNNFYQVCFEINAKPMA